MLTVGGVGNVCFEWGDMCVGVWALSCCDLSGYASVLLMLLPWSDNSQLSDQSTT